MIIRQPLGRDDLKIGRKARVLEIGSGHNPMYRSDVLIDKYTDDDSHRCGAIRIYPHQQFISAQGERLPFEDKAFDYVICNQVLEHAEDPAQFIAEITRVGCRGYIEVPSMPGELMFPKISHKWVILPLDGKLVFYEKSRMPGNYRNDYGELFLNYLPYQSLPFKMLYFSEPNLMITSIEWENDLEILVNPEDKRYSRFFTDKWDREMTEEIFPPRTTVTELAHTIRAGIYVFREKLIANFCNRKAPITIEEYRALQEKA